MKNLKSSLSIMVIIALMFTSCSKEETGVTPVDSEKATLSFGAIINDLTSNRTSKQAIGDIPECSNDEPAYVRIVLLQGDTEVVGTSENPYRVNLAPGQVFTVEDAELQLTPGDYTLDHFSVYNADNELIWLAPRGGAMANFVENPLPVNISLGAGVKKYVEVDVLCYDNRNVNEYGYLFFEIDTTEAIKFCIFGNYCPPAENGRHYPASFSVDVWLGTNATGEVLYDDVENITGYYDNGDFYADPVCFALPDREGVDQYYFEVTLRSSDEYGQVQERVIRRGNITDNIVRSFFDGEDNLEYYHFREGCGEDSPPIFENPEEEGEFYSTCLYPLNDSNAFALATFQLKNNVLKATVLATGVEPGVMHPQHIHGFTNGTTATCPDEDADENNDGLLTLEEGLPYYGNVLLALEQEDGTFPTADASGSYIYHRTFNVAGLNLPALEKTAVVAHGLEIGGTYMPSIPVACGDVGNHQ